MTALIQVHTINISDEFACLCRDECSLKIDRGFMAELLQAFFQAYEVPIAFVEGEALEIERDPVTRGDYYDLIAIGRRSDWLPTQPVDLPNGVAHLFLSTSAIPGYRGLLLDPCSRAFGAVFLTKVQHDRWLETCVHEVGHMLGLLHGHGNRPEGDPHATEIPTAMNRGELRDLVLPAWREEAWRRFGPEELFEHPALCLPLSPYALEALRGLDEDVLPWGNPQLAATEDDLRGLPCCFFRDLHSPACEQRAACQGPWKRG